MLQMSVSANQGYDEHVSSLCCLVLMTWLGLGPKTFWKFVHLQLHFLVKKELHNSDFKTCAESLRDRILNGFWTLVKQITRRHLVLNLCQTPFPRLNCPINGWVMHYPQFACSLCAVTPNRGAVKPWIYIWGPCLLQTWSPQTLPHSDLEWEHLYLYPPPPLPPPRPPPPPPSPPLFF